MPATPKLPDHHPVLGRLEHDEERNRYTGNVTARSRKVTIRLAADDAGSFARSEERAVRFARNPQTELDAAGRFLAGHFLDTANHDWGGGRLTVAALLERISARTVVFDGDGGVEYVYADGDVFGGHWLVARMRDDGVFFDAEIAG
jgi:hypothetical protein